MKVVGVKRPDGLKDFKITWNNVTWHAERHGQKFQCNGFVGTLKEIKNRIHSGKISADSEPWSDEIAQKAESTWDCVDPCALLVLFLDDPVANPEVRRTLDAYGWIDEGKPDRSRAERELRKFGELYKPREHSNADDPPVQESETKGSTSDES